MGVYRMGPAVIVPNPDGSQTEFTVNGTGTITKVQNGVITIEWTGPRAPTLDTVRRYG